MIWSYKAAEKVDNIYSKLGFVHVNSQQEPEKKAFVADVQSSSGWRRFCSHYLEKRENHVFINNEDCPCLSRRGQDK